MTDDSKAVIEEYAREIPVEVRSVIKALAEDARLAIIIALMKNPKLSFTELKDLFKLNSSSLTLHLSTLQNGGLVSNFFEKGQQGSYSYYSVTDLAEPILDSLYGNIIQVPVSKFQTEKDDAENPQMFKPDLQEVTSLSRLRRHSKEKGVIRKAGSRYFQDYTTSYSGA
jgi:DNA-binding transcriptional ArsR family regulator